MFWMQEVAITKSSRVIYAPIDYIIRVPASLDKEGRVVIYTKKYPYPGGFQPGIKTGDGKPILWERRL